MFPWELEIFECGGALRLIACFPLIVWVVFFFGFLGSRVICAGKRVSLHLVSAGARVVLWEEVCLLFLLLLGCGMIWVSIQQLSSHG